MNHEAFYHYVRVLCERMVLPDGSPDYDILSDTLDYWYDKMTPDEEDAAGAFMQITNTLGD